MCSEGPLGHPQGTEGHGQRPLPSAQDSGRRHCPVPEDAQGSGRRAPDAQLGHRAVGLPGAQPHCCGGSSQSGRQACSLSRPRTPETPSHRTRCPRCSHPISSRGLASPGDGCCTRRWQRSPRRRSVSLQRPLRRRRWRARRPIPGWLRKEA